MRLLALAGTALAFALSACNNDVGYVEIKVAPGFVIPPLRLGTTAIDTSRGGSAVLRERVGNASLSYERDGRLIAFCTFDVRKDRIVTVSVSALGRDPRCRVDG